MTGKYAEPASTINVISSMTIGRGRQFRSGIARIRIQTVAASRQIIKTAAWIGRGENADRAGNRKGGKGSVIWRLRNAGYANTAYTGHGKAIAQYGADVMSL